MLLTGLRILCDTLDLGLPGLLSRGAIRPTVGAERTEAGLKGVAVFALPICPRLCQLELLRISNRVCFRDVLREVLFTTTVFGVPTEGAMSGESRIPNVLALGALPKHLDLVGRHTPRYTARHGLISRSV